jgi:hypothetical protein
VQQSQQVSTLGGDPAARREIIELVCRSSVTEALAQRPAERPQLELLKEGIEDKAIGRMLTVAIWRADLEAACFSGDTGEIQRLLVSHYPKAGRKVRNAAATLLCEVLEATPVNRSVVKALVDGGVDINMPLKNGKTPWLVACGNADVETVSLLIQAGAVIDSSCWDGYTAMGHACRTGSLALTRLLLEGGASPTEEDPMGWSPVHHAQMFATTCIPDDPTYAERVLLCDELERAVAERTEGQSQ